MWAWGEGKGLVRAPHRIGTGVTIVAPNGDAYQVKLYFSFYMGELLLSLKQVSALTKKKILKHAVFLKMMKL